MIKEPLLLPPKQNNTFTWYGPEMLRKESEWLIHLTPAEITELEAAAELLESSKKNIATITRIEVIGNRLLYSIHWNDSNPE